MTDRSGIKQRLRKIASGEKQPHCAGGDELRSRAVRLGVNKYMRAWLQENGRYMTASDEQIHEQIDSAVRTVLSLLSGVAPALIDIEVDVEVVRHEAGNLAYAFKYRWVRN